MKTKIVSLLIISLFVFSARGGSSFRRDFVPGVFGQSPTPGEKVKEIRNAVKEKVREKLEETQEGQKKAFVGEIAEVSNSTLTLETRSGKQQAEVDEKATIIGKNRSEINFEDLEIGDYVIAIGYLDENEVLQAKRVVVTKELETPTRQVAVGRVTDISADEKIITVKNEKKGMIYTVEATTKTTITKKPDEGEAEKINFNKIEENDWLVAIGTPTENEEKIITAKLIHVIPGKSKPEPTPTEEVEESEEEPTPSPTLEE